MVVGRHVQGDPLPHIGHYTVMITRCLECLVLDKSMMLWHAMFGLGFKDTAGPTFLNPIKFPDIALIS